MEGTNRGRVSTLKVTDPELIEVFDNFAFDEVLRHASLDTRTRLMVQLAALIGSQALSEYRAMLGAALTSGVTPAEVKEIVYQAVPYDPQVKGHVAANLNVGNDRQTLISVITVLLPFIGYPRTLNALAAINEIATASANGTAEA
jgi:alkylhydroperoxidase/carboxymuconolactone decarboxylase family protein YurZ